MRAKFHLLHGPNLKLRLKSSIPLSLFGLLSLLPLGSCSDYYKNDYTDNSPTSGKLKVYYDEGLERHITNQAHTFEVLYDRAEIELFRSSEDEAIQALYNDSCEAIVVSRLLSAQEKKAFASKNYVPKHSAVAHGGLALITNINTPLNKLTVSEVTQLLSKPYAIKDSMGNEITLNVLFDKKNSSVLHYAADSLLRGKPLSAGSLLGSTLESINYVAQHKNTIAFIDFAWLSDIDDSLYKANKPLLKFIAIGRSQDSAYFYPDQSNFKLGRYPFIRTVYVMRKTSDFSLAKGFETFVAGPKGQLMFLKQGLLPARQGERAIQINKELPAKKTED